MNKMLSYYQKELEFLKRHGKIFASRFPKIAHRLGIVEGESEDPHVSRLIESFALLTSRIHQRLDENLPDVIEELLHAIAPQFLYPIPSCCIVQITPDPKQSGITGKNYVPANTALLSRQLESACQFQTIYDVTLLPLTVVNAKLAYEKERLNWKLKINFQIWQGALVRHDNIRIYLHGPKNLANTLYTLLCSQLNEFSLISGNKVIKIPTSYIRPTGFKSNDFLLKRIPKIAPIHSLLLDYFNFSPKFMFIDIQLPSNFCLDDSECFELNFLFNDNSISERLGNMAELINKDTFRLHCTPAVNLFMMNAEPIALNSSISEYPVIPNARSPSQFEVWDIHTVHLQQKKNNQEKTLLIRPLIEKHIETFDENSSGLFWQSFRREVQRDSDIEHRHFVAFSEENSRHSLSEKETINISVLCTNHSIPNLIKYGDPDSDFVTDIPVSGLKITTVTHPTPPIYPPDKNSQQWRLLSQLSLNLQLLSGKEGIRRLKEILSLYDFGDQKNTKQLLNLIHTLTCQTVTARIIKDDPHTLARGINITLGFYHTALLEPEYYLFCSLLDNFFSLYAPVNSFTRLTTFIEDHEINTRCVWPIRAGKLSWL